ncbi:right-handed parallel beta-helix repeat-containing protein [uncultured Roseobacter sp.]|uniref:right-handed parallel beta-helix repeat-containing protein n=1 Tax=uncultured Roseobacter sp. TaxID=114847 RepID=UPI0026394A64|nr:right-handed parallel beta-helix repeat-containing protein [uncultured Roseobacter sp.]
MNKAITDGAQLMPPPFVRALSAYSSGDGTPGSEGIEGSGRLVTGDGDFGTCLEITKTAGTQRLRYTGETPLLPGCYLRISARVKAVSGPLPSVRIAGFAGGPEGQPAPGAQTTGPSLRLPALGAVVEVSAIVGAGLRIGVDMIWGGAALYGHFGLDVTGSKGSVVRIESLEIEDVTSAFLRDLVAMVDVRDFGALGDGESDDATAFAAADAAAFGRTILVPRGQFYLGQDVALDAPVCFQGRVLMPGNATLHLRRNFDLPSYSAAFGDDAMGLRKGFQALMQAESHHSFDLGGCEIELHGPLMLKMAQLSSDNRYRKTVHNGQLTAIDGPGWEADTITTKGQWTAEHPTVLTAVANVEKVAVGAAVSGPDVRRETYVHATDAAVGTVTLSRPLANGSAQRTLTFTRYAYLLDFSEIAELNNFTLSNVHLQGNGVASGVMLAPQGAGMQLQNCMIQGVRNRALTSTGAGCANLVLDRCDIISNRIEDNDPVAINLNADGVRLLNCHVRGPHPFAHIIGNGVLVTGLHLQGIAGDTPGLILTQGGTACVIGNHFQNCTLVVGDGTTPIEPPGNLFS